MSKICQTQDNFIITKTEHFSSIYDATELGCGSRFFASPIRSQHNMSRAKSQHEFNIANKTQNFD